MVIRLFNRFRASLYWVSSLKLASKEQYELALKKISKVEQLMPNKAEITLLKGFLCFATDKDDLALCTLLTAWNLIGESSQYSLEEKKYLQCYASFFGKKITDTNAINNAYPFEVDYSTIHLNKVRKSLKDNFPLRGHPHWSDQKMQ